MTVSIKKAFVTVVIVLALLAALVGWTVRMVTMPSTPFHTGVHSTGVLAWYCPPPPRWC